MSLATFELDDSVGLPPYRQLESAIRNQIDDGTLAPGDRLPTIRQLCVQTGLAYGTVSKVTRSLVEEGLLIAKVGSGTHIADQTATVDRVGCLGVASVSSLADMRATSPYFASAFMALQDEVIHQGRVVAYDRYSSRRPILDLFNKLTAVDGIIVFNGYGVHAEEVLALHDRLPEIVLLGGGIECPQVTTIHADNAGDSRRATAELIALGHERIACYSPTDTSASYSQRRHGWQQAIQDAQLDPQAQLSHCGSWTDFARKLVATNDRPTAVFVAGGGHAIATAIPHLHSHGIHLGKHLQVAAWDEAHFYTLRDLGIPHLRITQQVDTLGHLAVQTLMELISGSRTRPETLLVPSRIETFGDPVPHHTRPATV